MRNKKIITKSYTANIRDINKSVYLQTNIIDIEYGLKTAKQKIIHNVLNSIKANDEQTTNNYFL